MDPAETGQAVLVLTTTADDESARVLSRALVEEGLAACVTRAAVHSTYRWEETPADGSKPSPRDMPVCEAAEVMLVIKTARSRCEALRRRILELHSYECPEIVEIVPAHVEASYLAWLLAACG